MSVAFLTRGGSYQPADKQTPMVTQERQFGGRGGGKVEVRTLDNSCELRFREYRFNNQVSVVNRKNVFYIYEG